MSSSINSIYSSGFLSYTYKVHPVNKVSEIYNNPNDPNTSSQPDKQKDDDIDTIFDQSITNNNNIDNTTCKNLSPSKIFNILCDQTMYELRKSQLVNNNPDNYNELS